MSPVDRLNDMLRRVPAWTVYVLAVLPPAWLFWQGATGGLGIDPVKAMEHRLGELALQLIIAGLAITPIRRIFGLNLVRYRRAIGIVSFAYVVLHFLCWLVLDMGLRLDQATGDIFKRPYITLGMGAMILMAPLALSSNNASVRRLGAVRWKGLHRLAYAVAILAALHFLWLVKAWPLQPVLYLSVILLLLGYRAVSNRAGAPASA